MVLIPVNMGSSWTIKKSRKHLPSPVILFPLLTHHKHLPIIFIQVLRREPGNQLDLFFSIVDFLPIIFSQVLTRESSLLWTCSRNGPGPAMPCRTISRRSNLRYTRTSTMKRMIWFDDDLPLVVTNIATTMFHDIKRYHDCEHDIKTIMTINRTILMTT